MPVQLFIRWNRIKKPRLKSEKIRLCGVLLRGRLTTGRIYGLHMAFRNAFHLPFCGRLDLSFIKLATFCRSGWSRTITSRRDLRFTWHGLLFRCLGEHQ